MNLSDQEVAALYERYAHVVFRRCRSILGNDEDAHDAVQETFAKVIRHAEEFRGQASPLTWMYRISTNHCLNQIRNRAGRRNKLEDHKHEIAGDDVRPADVADADRQRIIDLLDGCDEETRLCVVHTYFDDCTRQEVADLVGLSVPTVRKRINEFLDHARTAMGVSLAELPAVVAMFSILWGAA
jgi:RNA polymerase sigma-70 factor (ECF subfamily)